MSQPKKSPSSTPPVPPATSGAAVSAPVPEPKPTPQPQPKPPVLPVTQTFPPWVEIIQRRALTNKRALRLFRQSLASLNLTPWASLDSDIRQEVILALESNFRNPALIHQLGASLQAARSMSEDRLLRFLAHLLGFQALTEALA